MDDKNLENEIIEALKTLNTDEKAKQELKEIFEAPPDNPQKAVNKYILKLKELKLSLPEILVTVNGIMDTINEQLIIAIKREFNDTDRKNWEEIKKTNPTTDQQIVTLDKFLKIKTGKSIEEKLDELTEHFFNKSLEQLETKTEILRKVNKLTDEETELALNYLNNGEFIKADKIINKKN